jgi:sulfur relay (sulfurtransferase) DsrC/TusE family protein
MNSNFHLLFYLRKQKNYKGGTMAIYMRITVNGKRADMSTGRECDPVKWNSRAGRAIGTREEIKLLNNYLDSLQTKVRNAHQVLIDSNQAITTESLQNQFLGKSEKSRYLMQLFQEHNAKVKALIGNGFEVNTLKGYNTSIKHLTGFLQKEYGKSDIEINQLNHVFITGFEFYLKTECKCSGVSAAKYIKHLKKIFNHCIANSWLKQNPFINYKSTAKAKERTYLTQQELDTVANKKMSIEHQGYG